MGKIEFSKKKEHTIVFSGDKSGENCVAIILDKKCVASMISHIGISDRLITVNLNIKPARLNLKQVYARTTTHEDQEVEKFHNDLQTIIDKISKREVIVTRRSR